MTSTDKELQGQQEQRTPVEDTWLNPALKKTARFLQDNGVKNVQYIVDRIFILQGYTIPEMTGRDIPMTITGIVRKGQPELHLFLTPPDAHVVPLALTAFTFRQKELESSLPITMKFVSDSHNASLYQESGEVDLGVVTYDVQAEVRNIFNNDAFYELFMDTPNDFNFQGKTPRQLLGLPQEMVLRTWVANYNHGIAT